MDNQSNVIKAANVYIMREIYNIIKTKKKINNKFIIIDGKQEGGKSSYCSWYAALGLDLGKNRTKRIIDCALNTGKSGFNIEEINVLSDKTNVDRTYFESVNNNLIHVISMDIGKWKKFFEDMNTEAIVLDNLEMEVDSFLNGKMDDSKVLYKVIYYYINGKAYRDEHKQEVILDKVKKVSEIKPSEWLQCESETINSIITDLENTLSFLKAYSYYREAMNIENVKIK